MTTNEINQFRETLESRRIQLSLSYSKRETLAVETSPDELDQIQHANENDSCVASLQRNVLGLSEVREALGRIHAGAFGICSDCKEQIKPKRLAAVPWASLCIVCQKAADRWFGSLLAA